MEELLTELKRVIKLDNSDFANEYNEYFNLDGDNALTEDDDLIEDFKLYYIIDFTEKLKED